MSPLDLLAPDQKAVIQMVLQQGRSYEELAGMLGISGDAVRSRAITGIDRLVPDDTVSSAERAAVTDFLLGQQSVSGRERTRRLLAESPAARAWAQEVVAELASLAPGGMPDIGGEEAEPAAPAERAPRLAPRPAAPTADEAAARRSRRRRAAPEPEHEPEPEPAPVEADESLEPEPEREREPARPSLSKAARPDEVAGERPRAGRAASFLDDAFDDDDLFVREPKRGVPPAPPQDFVEDAETAEEERPRRAPRPAPGRASRLGGILIIVAIAAVLAAVIVWALTRGDDEEEPAGDGAQPTATQGPTGGTPQLIGQINLKGAGGSKAVGIAQVFQDNNGVGFQLAAEKLEPNSEGTAYAVWLYSSREKAARLGFTPTVGEEGTLVVSNALPPEADDYKELVVSLERDEQSDAPAKIVLRGPLSSTLKEAGG